MKIKIKAKLTAKQKIKIHSYSNDRQFLILRQNALMQVKKRICSNFQNKLVWG